MRVNKLLDPECVFMRDGMFVCGTISSTLVWYAVYAYASDIRH